MTKILSNMGYAVRIKRSTVPVDSVIVVSLYVCNLVNYNKAPGDRPAQTIPRDRQRDVVASKISNPPGPTHVFFSGMPNW